MKRMKKLIAAASAAVMLASASIVPVSAAYIRGDVNNDGVVNSKDYIAMLNYYYGYRHENRDAPDDKQAQAILQVGYKLKKTIYI